MTGGRDHGDGATPRGLLVNVPFVIGLAVTLGGGWFATWSRGEAARAELAAQLAAMKERNQVFPEFQSQQLGEIRDSQKAMQVSVLRELDSINRRLDRVEDRLK